MKPVCSIATGLFYRSIPTYTLAGKGDTGVGAKEQKNRLTLMPMVN
jgi:hypothetical protein